jgi:hypothetical protein
MIRFISYTGPKDVKKIELRERRILDFPQGVPLDIVNEGMSQNQAKGLLDSGLFRLHGEQSVPFDLPAVVEEAPALQCQCGFVAKNKVGLKAHMRACRK